MPRLIHSLSATCILSVLLVASISVHAQNSSPKYKADVPTSITTPDKVHTDLLGELEFFDGTPTKNTVDKTYDFLDVSRGVEVFLNGIPAASAYALLEGFKEAGVKPGELGIFEQLMDARSLFLTANSTTVYCVGEVNIKDGPVVIEVPPGVLGPIDDAYFRFVTDIGATGPDKGQGGKYLIVHRDYRGAIPEGYFVARSDTYRNLIFFRAFVKDGDLKGTADAVKAGYHTYPLSLASNPPKQKFHNLSGKKFNTIHVNDFSFFEEMNQVVQYEPADAFNPEFVGQLAAIGIKNGSTTIWFGPTAPKSHEGNWIQTMPGKGYCVLLRLYGPLEPWFNKTWKPGDFELVK